MSKWLFLCWFGLFYGLVAGICRADAPSSPSRFTLPNGLQVIVVARHDSPLVAVALWVRAGAREESAAEYGCAHFIEHTLFKGTTTRRAGDADIAIENLGAVLDAATGPDYALYYTTVGSRNLSATLDILSDVIANATLPEAEIERERGVILDELAQHDADPVAQMIDLLYANSYPSHPYGRSPGGSPNAIRALRRETLAAYYRRYYTPERGTLVLVGDCTPEQSRQEVERAFGGWRLEPPTGAPARTQPSRPQSSQLQPSQSQPSQSQPSQSQPSQSQPSQSQPSQSQPFSLNGTERNAIADDRAARSTSEPTAARPKEIHAATPYCMIGIAYPAPAAGDLDMACAGMVATTLLGDARGGRLAGAASLTGTEAAARYTPRLDEALLTLTARVPAQSHAAVKTELARLETEVVKSIEGLQKMPPTQDEFSAARRLVLGRLQFDTETGAGLARALGYAAIVGGDAPDALRTRLRQLTRADLQRFCRRFLAAERRVTLYLLPTTDITRRSTAGESE